MTNNFNALSFIRENSLTYTEIGQDYQNFLNALTEDEKLGFKTLFAGTNSKILLDVLSAKTSTEIYHIITSREENYLQYCNRIDSATAISQSKGYNVNRGSNIRVRITLTPNESITLSKFQSLCTVDEYDLIVTEDVELVAGVQTTIDTYLGTVKEQTLIADSEDLLIFRFTAQNVSDQIALYLNGVEVPITTNILEMLDDKYFCISNAFSSVDAIYLNKRTDFTHRYTEGSNLTLKYIEYQNILLTSIEIESLYGKIDDVEQLSTTVKPEDTASVKVHAQLYAETQNRIVARDDFPKVLQGFDPEILDAVGHDYTPAVVETTYVKKDGSLMNETEYQNCYNYLYKRRGYGIPMCRLTHPNIMLNLDVNVILQLNSGTTSVVEKIVRDVLSEYEYKLGNTINVSNIEESLESYLVVKNARLSLNYHTFTASTLVPEGYAIKPTTPNGKLYVVRNILNLTGTTEPTWPTEVGETVVDNDIIWKCQEKSYTPQATWHAGMSIVEGMIVWPTASSALQYICIGYNYKTGTTEPTWPTEEGGMVTDGQIQWMAITKNFTAPGWSAETITSKGMIVNATENNEVSYQAVNFLPTTPSTEPEWPTTGSVFTEGNIRYSIVNEEYDITKPELSNISLAWNQYVKFKETVVIA